jgi:glutamate mutase epsilon subunit
MTETALEKKARKKAEREAKRQQARENAENKKRFTLTPEKKRKLKLLIMKKAAEDLENEAREKAEAKRRYIEDRVKPLSDLSSSNEAQLVAFCKDLHRQIVEMEKEKYDIEMRIRKGDYEVNNIPMKALFTLSLLPIIYLS